MRRRWVSIERLRRVAAHAVLNGYGDVVPWTTVRGEQEFDRDGRPMFQKAVRLRLNMDCEDPYPFELVARWSASALRKPGIVSIWGLARCRKCPSCKARRAMFWTGRAMTEYDKWPRTIMGTFTMSPEKHQEFDWRLEVGEPGVRPAVDIFALSEAQRFTARASIFGTEITKWLKLVREGNAEHPKPQFRYLLIAEAHESEATSDVMKGRPHFHILMHEKEAGALVVGDVQAAMMHGNSGEWERRRIKTKNGWSFGLYAHNDSWMKTLWEHGHTVFQLAPDRKSAVYVCKYLTKSMHVRVRASLRYGGSLGEQGPRGGGAPVLERSDAPHVVEAGKYDPSKRHAEEGGARGKLQGGFPPANGAAVDDWKG